MSSVRSSSTLPLASKVGCHFLKHDQNNHPIEVQVRKFQTSLFTNTITVERTSKSQLRNTAAALLPPFSPQTFFPLFIICDLAVIQI